MAAICGFPIIHIFVDTKNGIHGTGNTKKIFQYEINMTIYIYIHIIYMAYIIDIKDLNSWFGVEETSKKRVFGVRCSGLFTRIMRDR